MFIYHRVPDSLAGEFLCPLNMLRDTQPELYAQHIRKYEGREFVLSQTVPNLGCLWNDVLHFSPVHPKLIVEAMSKAGFSRPPSRWFEIEPLAQGFNSSNASIFLHTPRERGDFDNHAEDFTEFSALALEKLRGVPPATEQYYKECKAEGSNPLVFVWVPHVLYRGKLEIGSLKIIEA